MGALIDKKTHAHIDAAAAAHGTTGVLALTRSDMKEDTRSLTPDCPACLRYARELESGAALSESGALSTGLEQVTVFICEEP